MIYPYYRLLLIEDSEDEAALAKHCILRSGLQCDITRVCRMDDLEGMLERVKPDAILCDCNVAGSWALHALRIAKRSAANSPFILISACATRRQHEEALSQGAAAVVEKGTYDDLVVTLRRTLAPSCEMR